MCQPFFIDVDILYIKKAVRRSLLLTLHFLNLVAKEKQEQTLLMKMHT